MRPHARHLEVSQSAPAGISVSLFVSKICKPLGLAAATVILASCGTASITAADYVMSSSASGIEPSEFDAREAKAVPEAESMPFWGKGVSHFENLGSDYFTELLRKAP